MQRIYNIVLLVFALGFLPQFSRATEILGGEISWVCQGNGDYIFQLKIYRDCNDIAVGTGAESLKVWGHPNITTIPLNYVGKTDLSPTCTAASGNNPLACGTGNNGGNGQGAIEQILYQSNPISITGIPPATGWSFTFQTTSRSASIINLQTPTSYGMTLSATMFPTPNSSPSGCIDSSPTFLQTPHFITCAGQPYTYNPHAVDTDLDSLVYKWGSPLTNFISGGFNPPANPIAIPFEANYGFNNPTPSPIFNASNQPMMLNNASGHLSFTSHTTGMFAAKIIVDSYRKGVKNATVEREMVFIVQNCTGSNTPPQITPPFNGNTSYEIDVLAGDLVNFSIDAKDFDLLQNNVNQTVTISSTGLMYGTGFANANSGCVTPPCATLDSPPSLSGMGGGILGVNWQTTCDHLVGTSGKAQLEVPYYFVFKVQDNYCPIPQMSYVTVKVNIKNKEILPAPQITCVTTDNNGNVEISWNPINDPYGVFVGYEINGVNGGSYGVVNAINGNSFVIPNGGNQAESFFVSTLSGCNGNTKRHSDTLANIRLNLNNPGMGEAILSWNNPSPIQQNGFGNYYHIYKEYPAGTWTLIDSTLYGVTNYRDTITVCSEIINYRIVLSTANCEIKSNIEGDLFKDKIVPDIPEIIGIDIDTLTSNITLTWTENTQQDTYGYVVYLSDNNGNFVEIDTVWGIANTNYTHYLNPTGGPYQYSIAAFDSCYTTNVPPTYQTSAKALPHTSNFLKSSLDVCSRSINLNWSGYIGYNVSEYLVFANINQQGWTQVAQTTGLNHSMHIEVGDDVFFVVQAVSNQGIKTFSNVDTLNFIGSSQPAMSYLSVATVSQNQAEIIYRCSLNDGIKRIELERYEPVYQDFIKIDEAEISQETEILFIDEDAEVNKRSYTYRIKVIDTCGQSLGYTNIGRTIYSKVITDEVNERHTIQWTPYGDFIGNLLVYEVYRAIDGENYSAMPIASLPPNIRTYTDDVSAIGDYDNGSICYLVIAVEGTNEFGLHTRSYSNRICGYIPPSIYIPNAFTVGGHNPIFKPETRQREIDAYHFEIYNRNGQIVFSTTDPNEGWDGTIKNKMIGYSNTGSEQVYLYRLALRDGNGIEIVKYGHVTLLNDR